jgi:hypothetical protein
MPPGDSEAWRKEANMYKLFTIGALVVALVAPASAVGKSIPRPHNVRAQIDCPKTVVIMPTRGYGFCGGRIWVRDLQTGEMTTTPFWRLKLRNERPDDHP